MKKTINFFIFIFAFFGIGETFGLAAQNLDSLYTLWQDPSQPDSIRAKAYDDYIWKGFLFTNPDTAAILADELIAFGEKQSYLKAKSSGFNTKGVSFYIKGDYPQALNYYSQSLKIREQQGDQNGVATSLNNIGIIYANKGDYPQALNYYLQSLKIREQQGDQKGIAGTVNNIGNIYENQGDYPQALAYFSKSLKSYEQLGNQNGMASSLNNIGNLYKNQGNYPKALEYYSQSLKIRELQGDQKGLGNTLNNIGLVYADQGDYPQALEYNNQSLKVREQAGDQSGIAVSLYSIAGIYKAQGEYLQALDYYSQSLKIKEQIGDQNGITAALNSLGFLHLNQEYYSKALIYCQKGYDLAVNIGVLIQQEEACRCLYYTYKAMGNGNKALVYLEKMRAVEDSLYKNETSKKLQQMEFQKAMLQDSIAKAEEARLVQETHQAEMRQEAKTRNWSLAGGTLALLMAGGFYSRWRYVQKSKTALQTEKDRSDNLLLNILPADIAQELKEKGKADARDFDMVSILFTDFKSFTEQSAKLSAAELVNEINHCFEAFDGISEKYGIEKIKTIGDAYMAAGGLPVPTDDSVKNTVLAALEMQEFILQRHQTKVQSREAAFEMRVGIHTGPVVAGIVGVKKFQYDIWGDTVNTASRMESHGEVGKVNISQATYELLKDDAVFEFESRGKIEVKGKGEIEMLFVTVKNE